MSFFSGTTFELRPYHFTYPERRLMMEEMLYKFIDEGIQEHEETRAFINEFRTTNELLFKERNNSLTELRGGKTINQDIQDDNTDMHTEEPLVVNHDKPVKPKEVLVENQHQKTNEPVVQPLIKVQTPSIPFPRSPRSNDKVAKFLKGFLMNKTRLEEACTITMNERCSAILLNKLASKEKDPGSFTIPCDIGKLHINNALADLVASISLMSYTMYEKLGLEEHKPNRMSLELADRSIQYPRGIVENVLIKVDKFVLPIDFVILDMAKDSMRPPNKDDECYGIDDLDDTINMGTQELLANDKSDLFLIKGLEKSINQSDLESYESLGNKSDDDSDLEKPIQCINSSNTPYSVAQETTRPDGVENSLWVSPIHVVLKKGGMTVVLNDDNELIPSRTVIRWHKISKASIEVDRAKIDVIAKLPYPTNVKGVRSFLGHAGFYR
nr:hypothetical protein [Tanacetum cinerariifolium]